MRPHRTQTDSNPSPLTGTPLSNTSTHTFKKQQQNLEAVIARSPIPVILDCYADWCEPCKKLTPVLETLVSDLLLFLFCLPWFCSVFFLGLRRHPVASVTIPPPTSPPTPYHNTPTRSASTPAGSSSPSSTWTRIRKWPCPCRSAASPPSSASTAASSWTASWACLRSSAWWWWFVGWLGCVGRCVYIIYVRGWWYVVFKLWG